MENNEQSPEDYIEIADKVRSGEYFREARTMFDIDAHEPVSERYWYVFLTFVSLCITVVSIIAFLGFFPLKIRIPFIFSTNDIVDDYPRIKSLLNYVGEDPNFALRRHLIQHYVKLREEYDALVFDRNHNAVLYLSTEGVLKEYEKFVSPLNPYGPVAQYQRHTQRKITVLSTADIPNNNKKEDDRKEYNMRVIYDSVRKRGEQEVGDGQYKVDIAFIFKDIKLNKETGEIEPYGFIVTSYRVESLSNENL